MDILILSGFLGSGKTSLLLTLVEELSRSTDKKIAIIENEVGTVGVDNQVLQSEGLPVKELFSGCIC
jgi:G3E family GTPase